jgi:hypothetical protein
MTFERRDFLKIGSAGLAAGLVNSGLRAAQAAAPAVKGELESGTGSLRLEGHLKSGLIQIEMRDLVQGLDRTVIANGRFNSRKFYNAVFSYNRDHTVFVILADENHSTTLVLSDSDVPEIGRVTIWHDSGAPQSFRVKKKDFVANDAIVDEKGARIDLVGKRKPLDFTPRELEEVFGNDPALLKFRRGIAIAHNPSPDTKLSDWICRLLSAILGIVLVIHWEANLAQDT